MEKYQVRKFNIATHEKVLVNDRMIYALNINEAVDIITKDECIFCNAFISNESAEIHENNTLITIEKD